MISTRLSHAKVGGLYWYFTFDAWKAGTKLFPMIVVSEPYAKDKSVYIDVITEKGIKTFHEWATILSDDSEGAA